MVVKPFGIIEGVKGRRGFPVTKIAKPKAKTHKSKRSVFVKDIIDEIGGLAPYELRLFDVMEMSEKRAQRFAKRRLGSLQRAKAKLRKLEEVKRKIRRREAERKAEHEAKKH